MTRTRTICDHGDWGCKPPDCGCNQFGGWEWLSSESLKDFVFPSRTPWQLACERGHFPVVRALLKTRGQRCVPNNEALRKEVMRRARIWVAESEDDGWTMLNLHTVTFPFKPKPLWSISVESLGIPSLLDMLIHFPIAIARQHSWWKAHGNSALCGWLWC